MLHPSPRAPHGGQRRVAITGAGVITSMGIGWRANADGFRQGRNALGVTTLFDTSRQRTSLAGEVDLPKEPPVGLLSSRELARFNRATRLLSHAADEAWRQSGWGERERREDVPIILGTSAGAMSLGEDYFRQATATPSRRRGQATRVDRYQPQAQAMTLAKALGVSGPITIISNACASGANAIGHAFRQIRRGRVDLAICGGYDALCQLVYAGFDSLQALTPTTPRPFDANRDGLALGEGAGVFLLECWERARSRGAEILGEITGYGMSTDVHHLTQPHPDGDAALASMEAACRDAGLSARDVDYLNAHGTGTPLNDSAEARAIQRWAGDDAARLPVSSTKGWIGHLLGGAGAVEAAICLMALREGWLPPNTPVAAVDPSCAFDLVQAPRAAELRHALTNSFGFGGANASLVLSHA